jgi:exodeoxyribonuclease VII small subunit
MVKKLNFEQSLARLSEISAAMNDAGLELDESVKLYGEAVGLIDICKRRIESAKLEVAKIESSNVGSNESKDKSENEESEQ